MKHEPTDFDRLDPYDRYKNDNLFHALVETLFVHMKQAQYTPTELREACHLAACMYEEQHVRPLFTDPKEPFKWNVRAAR